MKVEILDPSSPAWARYLTTVTHDFYHLPSYAAVTAKRKHGEPRAVFVDRGDEAVLLPVVLRRVPIADTDAIDAVSPFGYSGPLFRGGASPQFVGESSAAICQALRGCGAVAAFVRFHPLLNVSDAHLFKTGTVIEHGQTISIDLTKSEEQLWRETRHGHRYQIQRAMNSGTRVYIDEQWRRIDDFLRLYRSTMRRVNAAPYYNFKDEHFRDLREALGTRVHLAIVEIDGKVAAGGLFVESCGIVQYHLSGMDDAYVRVSPTKLMLHHVRTWARNRGNRVLHLGGGLGSSPDSLFLFKAGFSEDRNVFRTWRIIIDEARYRRLVQARGPQIDPNDMTAFFPAYRRADHADEEL